MKETRLQLFLYPPSYCLPLLSSYLVLSYTAYHATTIRFIRISSALTFPLSSFRNLQNSSSLSFSLSLFATFVCNSDEQRIYGITEGEAEFICISAKRYIQTYVCIYTHIHIVSRDSTQRDTILLSVHVVARNHLSFSLFLSRDVKSHYSRGQCAASRASNSRLSPTFLRSSRQQDRP